MHTNIGTRKCMQAYYSNVRSLWHMVDTQFEKDYYFELMFCQLI